MHGKIVLYQLEFLLSAAIVCMVLVPSESAMPFAVAASIPNLVIFLADDMGIMDSLVPFLTDAAGKPQRYPFNEDYRTPNLQGLCEHGIRFSNFQAKSFCSPSRISLLTGQHSARHRPTDWNDPEYDNLGPQVSAEWNWKGLRKSNVNLAKVLKERGYRTIHVGKGHFELAGSDGADPTNLGFDVNIGEILSDHLPRVMVKKTMETAEAISLMQHRMRFLTSRNIMRRGTPTFLTAALTIEAKAQVSLAVKADQPFCMHLSH